MPPQRKPDVRLFSSGVLNVDKAAGETSFAVVRRLRRLTSAHRVGHAGTLAADANPFHTAAKAFLPFVAPLITWVFLSSVTSSYVAANTQTSRVIFAGARGGLWPKALAGVTRPT